MLPCILHHYDSRVLNNGHGNERKGVGVDYLLRPCRTGLIIDTSAAYRVYVTYVVTVMANNIS